jgi:hypothetical protein
MGLDTTMKQEDQILAPLYISAVSRGISAGIMGTRLFIFDLIYKKLTITKYYNTQLQTIVYAIQATNRPLNNKLREQ